MPKIKGRHGMLHDAQSTSNTADGLSVYVFVVIVLEDSVLDAVGKDDKVSEELAPALHLDTSVHSL